MPTAQPGAITDLEDPIIRAYARAWERIEQQQQALQLEPLRWRRRARLAEMQRAIAADMDELDDVASAWVRNRLPVAYGMGAASGAAEAGASATWTQVAKEAVAELAVDTFGELLRATKTVRESTKRLIREVAKDEVLQKMIEGDTAEAAGRRMARILADKGIHAVTYSNGAKHGLAEYAQTVVRTKTAVAYNTGSINAAEGVKYFEVFDGPFCGWTHHDDSVALGRIVSRDEALAYPIAHPGCRRAFGARPDVLTRDQAKEATRSVTPSQTEAQREADRRRRETQRNRRNAKARRDRRLVKESAEPALPQPPSASPAARRSAARAERRAERRGDLDLTPPSADAEDFIPPPSLDPYAGVKSVEELILEGFTPEDAVKEHKRLKANAASKASKAKAKAKAAMGDGPAPKGVSKAADPLLDEDIAAYKAWADAGAQLSNLPNPKLLHGGDVGLGGTSGTARWWAPMTTDTPNYVPVRGIEIQGHRVEAGIVTRRDGRVYLMETKAGEAVTPAQVAEFEANIKVAQEALADTPAHLRRVQESFAFLRGNNPADAHWAKAYNKPGFKSAATGGNGSTVFWNSKVTHGTVRHEFGHNVDYRYAKQLGMGTKGSNGGEAWIKAGESDKAYSLKHHAGAKESFTGNHPLTPGQSGVTTYGQASLAEDFAESVRLYLKDRYDGKLAISPEGMPIRFHDMFPERAKQLDSIFKYNPPAHSEWYVHQLAKAETYAFFHDYVPAGQLADVFGIKTAEAEAFIAKVKASKAKTAPKVKAVLVPEQPGPASGALPLKDMKKALPANVKASIASKKSNSKKDALALGKTADEAQAIADAVEAAEVEKRWRALFGSGEGAGGGSAASTGVPGTGLRPDFSEAKRAAADRWVKEAGPDPAKAKDALVKGIAGRLAEQERAWEELREYLAKTGQKVSGTLGYPSVSGVPHNSVVAICTKLKYAPNLTDAQVLDHLDYIKGLTLEQVAKTRKSADMFFKARPGSSPGHPSGLGSFAETTVEQRAKAMYDQVNRRVATWAANSGDSHDEAIWMQMAVKEEFGVTGNPFVAMGAHGRQRMEDGYRNVGGWYRMVARAQYEQTQEEFRRAGIKEVAIYRGMSFGRPPPDWAQFGQRRPELMPINSWSTSRAIAARFANGAAGNGGGPHKVIIQATIPVELVLGSARTGFGCLSEYEFVVLDADGLADVVPL